MVDKLTTSQSATSIPSSQTQFMSTCKQTENKLMTAKPRYRLKQTGNNDSQQPDQVLENYTLAKVILKFMDHKGSTNNRICSTQRNLHAKIIKGLNKAGYKSKLRNSQCSIIIPIKT